MRRPDSCRDTIGRFFFHAAIILAVAVAVSLLYTGAKAAHDRSRAARGSGAVGSLRARLAFYAAHRDDFDLVFAGDSRVLCAVQPEQIAPLLGVQSINLGEFAHWLPTQYPFLRDLVPLVPPEATLVLGVGIDNFRRPDYVRATYPLRWDDLARYRDLGFSWLQMAPNLLAPLTGLYLDRQVVRDKILNLLDRPLPLPLAAPSPAAGSGQPLGDIDPLDEELRRVRADPSTTRVDVLRDSGQVTSLAVYHRGGSYERIEIDGEFFRRRQRENRVAAGFPLTDRDAAALPLAAPDPGQLGLFTAMLDLVRERGVRLVVLEIEDAPYTYRHPLIRERQRRWMDQLVRPLVETRGGSYLRLPLESLRDADFFDHNHLNRTGIARYTPLLAAGLAPLLAGR